MAVGANSASVPDRIARLLDVTRPAPPARDAAPVAILLLVAAYGLFGQTERPAFQVASVKPHVASARHAIIVQNAYRVQAFQILGEPPWMNSVWIRR